MPCFASALTEEQPPPKATARAHGPIFGPFSACLGRGADGYDPSTIVTAAIATIPTTDHLARIKFSDKGTKVLLDEWHRALASARDLDTVPAEA